MTWKRGAVVALKWVGVAVVAGAAQAITESVKDRIKKKIDNVIGKPDAEPPTTPTEDNDA